MPDFLVCGNSCCRFVLDLQEAQDSLLGSEPFLKNCPECGSEWSTACPSCARPVSVTWRGHRALCAHCRRQFHTPAAA
jgi:hypothetical protein